MWKMLDQLARSVASARVLHSIAATVVAEGTGVHSGAGAKHPLAIRENGHPVYWRGPAPGTPVVCAPRVFILCF